MRSWRSLALVARTNAVKRGAGELGLEWSRRTRCSRGREERVATHSMLDSRFHGTRAWWYWVMSRTWASSLHFSRAVEDAKVQIQSR